MWEDPGFVLVESAYMNVPIISSDCDNGPKEILAYGKNGILFKSNNKASLLDAFIKFENMDKKVINKKTLDCKKAINTISEKFGGRGGGNKNLAQAGCKKISDLKIAIEVIKNLL